ncbi:FAD binding domain-containing protein [Sphingomonas morindae]|uniref:FAD-dependent monooxygenase n=1 Tax=Sphingomonas morindae TaxID=1541170 RepID=A0ABY4X7E0_9SPHN|nr:FAD-dependent monooxygenase [Sphingomonas morindae]USI72827.1 FAD-dependent monooxygenase [Sphingomonas morindae]
MRVAIAGGSLGGLFAGALLRRDGHEVTILERSASGLDGRGAGLVAQEEVFAILRALGRPEVATTGVTAHERITLDRAGGVAHRDARSQMQISWDALYLAVRDLMPDGCYRIGAAVDAAGSDGDRAWLRTADGGSVGADIVIGADGIGSVVRGSMFASREVEPHYAGYVAWRFLLPEPDLAPISVAALSERFAFYHMTGGQALGYLVAGPRGEIEPGRRRYNCVWYRRVADLPGLLVNCRGEPHLYSLPRGSVPADVRDRLVRDAYALLPPPFAAVVEAEPEPFVQAIFDLEVPRMTNGRLALLGDAAFIARPHTAMGVAKAAGDAMALADALRREPVNAALRRYDAERSRVGQAIVQYGRRLGASLE